MLYETIAVSIFARAGTHDTTGSRIRRSDIALVPQILEQKRDCSQSNILLIHNQETITLYREQARSVVNIYVVFSQESGIDMYCFWIWW